jgi:hypothetical protein
MYFPRHSQAHTFDAFQSSTDSTGAMPLRAIDGVRADALILAGASSMQERAAPIAPSAAGEPLRTTLIPAPQFRLPRRGRPLACNQFWLTSKSQVRLAVKTSRRGEVPYGRALALTRQPCGLS